MKINRVLKAGVLSAALLTGCGKAAQPTSQSMDYLANQAAKTVELGIKSADKALNDEKFIPSLVKKVGDFFKKCNEKLEKYTAE